MSRNRIVPTVVGFVVALLAVAMLAVGVSYAQQAGAGRRSGQPAMAGRAMTGGGPLARMRLGLGQLGLSQEQKDQVGRILRERAAELRRLSAEARKARRAVNRAVVNDEGEASIRAASAELAKAEADVAVLRAGVHKQIVDVLTPEQQAKAKAIRLRAQKRIDRFVGNR